MTSNCPAGPPLRPDLILLEAAPPILKFCFLFKRGIKLLCFIYTLLITRWSPKKKLAQHEVRSFEMPIVSAISRTFIRRSSNTISCTCSMISGVVALFGHPSRGSSSRLVRPRLNWAAHFLIVENEGEESPHKLLRTSNEFHLALNLLLQRIL